jgi:hypothetical protein
MQTCIKYTVRAYDSLYINTWRMRYKVLFRSYNFGSLANHEVADLT